jgi:hypothetical protein
MFTGFDLDGLRRGINLGTETALGLHARAQAIDAACAYGAASDQGSGAAIVRVADHVFAVSSDIGTRVTKLEAMLDQVHDQSWIAPLFASDGDLMYSLLALAGLTEGEVLRSSLGDIINHVQDISAERDWMDALSVEDRRRWNVLFGLRWLDELNARGANNCFDGVLHFFQDISAITPGSFASLVDAQILCAFQDGVAKTLGRAGNRALATGANQWAAFFSRQQSLAPGQWDNQSVVGWVHAEQAATEAGYRWADRRHADPSARLAAMALGAEAYRWLNRQRGATSDPLAGVHHAPQTLIPIEIPREVIDMVPEPGRVIARVMNEARQADPYVLLDPREPNYTYLGAKALDDAARSALIAETQDPSAPERQVPMATFKIAAAAERRSLDAFGAAVSAHRLVANAAADPIGTARHGAAVVAEATCDVLPLVGVACS